MKKLITLVGIFGFAMLINGCSCKQVECTKPVKQISKLTSGLQYSHCYDANYTW